MEWVIPAVALLLLIWAFFVHRRLVAMRELAEQAWSEVDALFRQRQELIPRLIDTVQGPLGASSRAVRTLTDARRKAANAPTPAAIGQAEAALNAAIQRVFALGQAKAELSADPGFRRLRSEFAEAEERIEEARSFFNEAVEDYNTARVGFPGGFISYAVNIPKLEQLAVVKAAEPQPL